MLQEVSDCGDWRIYGSLNPKILVAGHSHTFQMFMAVQRRPEYRDFFGVVTHANFENQIRPNNNYWNFVAELAKNQTTAISWNGNQHNLHFLVDANLKFNSVGLIQGKNYPFVSTGRIKELFRPTFYELGLILSRFTNRENIYLLGTPAPKSKKYIDKNIEADGFFNQIGEEWGIPRQKIKASSNDLRAYMWKITQELTAKTAAEFGCKYVPIPKETHDEDGILLNKYYADDLTHANEDLAALVMDQLMEKYNS